VRHDNADVLHENSQNTDVFHENTDVLHENINVLHQAINSRPSRKPLILAPKDMVSISSVEQTNRDFPLSFLWKRVRKVNYVSFTLFDS
jgi:hypothetical protein